VSRRPATERTSRCSCVKTSVPGASAHRVSAPAPELESSGSAMYERTDSSWSACGSRKPRLPPFAPGASGTADPALRAEPAAPRTSMSFSSPSSQSTRPSSIDPGGSSASRTSRTVSAASEKLVNRLSARRASALRTVPLTRSLSATWTKV
jgi:hypothetical protein